MDSRFAERIAELDSALPGLVKPIRVLKYLNWPDVQEEIFLEAGQDEREAYKSTQRIFRGGDVRGGVAFTKDSAYLKGVMEAHVLMNVAIRDNRPQVIERLFAGRLAFGDTILLGPYFDSGFLSRPHYVPPWAEDTRRLAASLAYSSFMMSVSLESISVDSYVAAVERSEAW